MDHKTLVGNYRLLKTMKDISLLLKKNESNPEISKRMKWDIYETKTYKYTLFFTKEKSELQLSCIGKNSLSGNCIAKVYLSDKKSYTPNTTKCFVKHTNDGFVFSGEGTSVLVLENSKTTSTEIEVLPMESVRSLLVNNELEELMFQQSMVYNLNGNAFEMICIISLLVNVDKVNEKVENNNINILLDKSIDYDDVHELQKKFQDFKNKLTLDFK